MVEYQPTSRRPIAQMFRRTGDAAANLCVRLGIPPDAISYLSILAALTAALCFWKSGRNAWLLIIAPLFCFLRLWFNILDGDSLLVHCLRGTFGPGHRRAARIWRNHVEAMANGCAEPRGLGDVCVS